MTNTSAAKDNSQYSALGKVVHGDKVGRTLGFPTANLEIIEGPESEIPQGVYACICTLPDFEESENQPIPYPGLLHVGTRSTFGEDLLKWEVHLLNFDADIYGQNLSLRTVGFIRGSKKFDSVDRLVEQMIRDKSTAEKLLFGPR